MKVSLDQLKRVGGIAIEVAFGLFLLTILLTPGKTSKTEASVAKGSLAANNAAAGSMREPLLPIQGTPCIINCPSDVTAAAAASCTLSQAAVVNFTNPTGSGSCAGVTAVCSPASGNTFPVGTTTVTCTATDAGGNTASCSFNVTVFSGCVQDDSNSGVVAFFNALTGEYLLCCGSTVYSGIGRVSVRGCIVTVEGLDSTRRVLIKFDGAGGTGSASLQDFATGRRCSITDRNVFNNTCTCNALNGT